MRAFVNGLSVQLQRSAASFRSVLTRQSRPTSSDSWNGSQHFIIRACFPMRNFELRSTDRFVKGDDRCRVKRSQRRNSAHRTREGEHGRGRHLPTTLCETALPPATSEASSHLGAS